VRTPLLTALLGSGLLAACNFPAKDDATVGSQGLWIANGAHVIEFNPAELARGTSAAAPHVSINSEIFGAPQGVTFDQHGNLYVVDPSAMIKGVATPAIYVFSASQLAALGADDAPEPVTVITTTYLKSPRQAAIDTAGNAYVTDYGSNAMLIFTAAQLATSGTNASPPVLFVTSPGFNGPAGIVFDEDGNLWISNNGIPAKSTDPFGGGTTIVGIAAANIPAIPETGTLPREQGVDVTLTDAGNVSIQSPWGLAFDSSGNLWSANSQTSTVVQFPKVDLATGSPTPAATLSSATVGSAPSLNQPHGLCIDSAGNVAAISAAGAFGISIYASNQLATGAPAPSTFLVGSATTLNSPAGCAFGPTVE